MTQYLSPKTDITFKKVFGNEHHKKITISFLNAILQLKDDQRIKEINFVDVSNIKEAMHLNTTFVDVHCIDGQGNHFLIEMQLAKQTFFIQRSLYYLALVFSRQYANSMRYSQLMPVTLLAILDHVYFKEHNNVISHYTFSDLATKLPMPGNYLNVYYIELAKFTKNADQLENECDEWLYFMNQQGDLQSIPNQMQTVKEFQEAFHILDKMKWTDAEFYAYIGQMDAAGKEERVIQAAIQDGIELGIEKGIEKGALQKAEKFAIKLLQKGVSASEVSDLSELSIEQINLLAQQIKNK